MTKHAILTTLLVGLVLIFSPARAQVFKTQKQALEQAFTECDTVKRNTVFLTDKQVAKIQKKANAKLESKLATYYVGVKSDSVTGYAFFETNIVRTKPETFMVVVNPDGSVRFVEILAFYEPMDYLPTDRWFRLFEGKVLNNELWPKRGIHNISGATLSVRAITLGVRRILATYDIAIAREVSN